jgi:hypothetical protein
LVSWLVPSTLLKLTLDHTVAVISTTTTLIRRDTSSRRISLRQRRPGQETVETDLLRSLRIGTIRKRD